MFVVFSASAQQRVNSVSSETCFPSRLTLRDTGSLRSTGSARDTGLLRDTEALLATGSFGHAVSNAGDFNGDGFDDVMVGAPQDSRVQVFFGGPVADDVADITFVGDGDDWFGHSIGSAGDVNGDGFDDLIIGGYVHDDFRGSAYIFFGGASPDGVPDVTMTGEQVEGGFGHSVSGAGDINGDGFDDWIVGSPWDNTGGDFAGRAFVFFGGPSPDNVPDLILTAEAAGDEFGDPVSGVGDMNGDGYDDIVVGADLNDAGGTDAGRAYVYFGGPTPDTVADLTLTGEEADDHFGVSVSNAGDVNGDGYDDLIVGAWNNFLDDGDVGTAYVYFGGASPDAVADLTVRAETEDEDDRFGFAVSGAGDLNDDGYDDVMVGATEAEGNGFGSGRAYVYYGGSAPDATPDLTMTGLYADGLGRSVSDAGDFNGDGRPDVIVGATEAGSGEAYIYFGGALDGISPAISPSGQAGADRFGASVSDAGDVNGDGFADVIVGAPNNDAGGTDAGRAYVYFGGRSADDTPDLTLTGEAAFDLFGASVSGAGDVNGDGFADVIVGAPNNDAGGTDAGRAYVYFGGPSADDIPDLTLTGEAALDAFGASVSDAGDFDSDGFDDVIVGAYRNNGGGRSAGRAYVYLGGPSADDVADFTLTGVFRGDLFGRSVSNAGDINGDGHADVVVGTARQNAPRRKGSAHVFYGGPSANEEADRTFRYAVTLGLSRSRPWFRSSVSGAGDMNGDGFDDIIVGVFYPERPGTSGYFGRAYVFYGAPFADDVADLTLTGVLVDDLFGSSVSGAGDINGDGFDDVIVGAIEADECGLYNVGAAYVFYGSPTADEAPDLALVGESARSRFGSSVSGAGDVNGDGFDDVIVGGPRNHSDGSVSGAAYLYQFDGGELALSRGEIAGITGDHTVAALEAAHAVAELPTEPALHNAYPNPFNPQTNLTYDVAEADQVHVAIYDAIGREVALLVDRHMEAGRYQATFDARRLPSGIYFVRMTTGSFLEMQRVTLIK